jgi:hypothetical protein
VTDSIAPSLHGLPVAIDLNEAEIHRVAIAIWSAVWRNPVELPRRDLGPADISRSNETDELCYAKAI